MSAQATDAISADPISSHGTGSQEDLTSGEARQEPATDKQPADGIASKEDATERQPKVPVLLPERMAPARTQRPQGKENEHPANAGNTPAVARPKKQPPPAEPTKQPPNAQPHGKENGHPARAGNLSPVSSDAPAAGGSKKKPPPAKPTKHPPNAQPHGKETAHPARAGNLSPVSSDAPAAGGSKKKPPAAKPTKHPPNAQPHGKETAHPARAAKKPAAVMASRWDTQRQANEKETVGPVYLSAVKGKLHWTDERLHRLVLLFEAEGHPAVPACQAYARPRDIAQRACQELAKALATVMANGLFDAPEPGRKRHPTIGQLSVCYWLPDSECVWAMNATNVKECPCKNPQHDARRRFITTKEEFYQTTLAADVRHLLHPIANGKPWARDFALVQATAQVLFSATSRYWHQIAEMVDPIAELLATRVDFHGSFKALAESALTLVDTIIELLERLLSPRETEEWELHEESARDVSHSLSVVRGFRPLLAELSEVWRGLLEPDAGWRNGKPVDIRGSVPLLACVPAVNAAAVFNPRQVEQHLQRLQSSTDASTVQFTVRRAEAPPLHYPASTVESAKKDGTCYRLADQMLETNLTRTKRIDDAFLLCLMAMGYQYALSGRLAACKTEVACRRFDEPSEWEKVPLLRVAESAPGELLIEAHTLIKGWNVELGGAMKTIGGPPPLQYLQFAHGYYTLHPDELKAATAALYADWRLRQVIELSRRLGVAVRVPPIPLSALRRFAQKYEGGRLLSPLHDHLPLAIRAALLPAEGLQRVSNELLGTLRQSDPSIWTAVVIRAKFHEEQVRARCDESSPLDDVWRHLSEAIEQAQRTFGVDIRPLLLERLTSTLSSSPTKC